MTPGERLAQRFHETYERLAPSYGYETREASAKPWADVPEQNKALMIAVATELLQASGPLDTDWGREAQQAAEAHLQQCDDWMDYGDDPDSERPAGDDPSYGPYDGCQTCMVREALYAAMPYIEEGLRAQLEVERSSSQTSDPLNGR